MSELQRSHAPKVPTVADLFKHFGGKDLEEESDVSHNDDPDIEGLGLPDDQALSEVSSKTQSTDHSAEGTNGRLKTFFVLLKGFVAIGVLYLPSGCYNAGLYVSIGVCCIIPWLIAFGLSRLVQCRAKTDGSYSEIAREACGRVGEFLVDLLLFLGQV